MHTAVGPVNASISVSSYVCSVDSEALVQLVSSVSSVSSAEHSVLCILGSIR